MDADHATELATLETTSDDVIRNQLALRLADARVPGTPDVLLRLIARDDLVNRRGTLVYSLGQFDCSGYVPQLVHLVATGNFEVAHTAFYILADIEETVGPDLAPACTEVQAAISAVPEDWRRDLLSELLDGFEQRS